MFTKKRIDFLAIGDIVTDAFIRLHEASVHCDVNDEHCTITMPFGDKIPYEFVDVIAGVGNSSNAAVSAARLGLSSSLIAHVGTDQQGKECLDVLTREKVDSSLVRANKGMKTNYHYVLWYEEERTILVKHEAYPYSFPKLATPPKWIYLSSMAGSDAAIRYHGEIAAYCNAHPEVKLAFQPGTFQIKMGTQALADIYKRTEVFFCNLDEAQRILNSKEEDPKKLMEMLRALGPKIVFVTDGFKGAYAYDGTTAWFMGVYPHKPYERTGAGDAFASCVTSALALGKTVEEALLWGPINSMSVVLQVGAQKGLLTQKQIAEFLAKAPADYKPKRI